MQHYEQNNLDVIRSFIYSLSFFKFLDHFTVFSKRFTRVLLSCHIYVFKKIHTLELPECCLNLRIQTRNSSIFGHFLCSVYFACKFFHWNELFIFVNTDCSLAKMTSYCLNSNLVLNFCWCSCFVIHDYFNCWFFVH